MHPGMAVPWRFHFLHFVTFDQGERLGHTLVVADAERVDRMLPVEASVARCRSPVLARERQVPRTDGHAAFGQPVEAAEDGEAEAVVDEVAFADQLAVLVDLLDIALHRAGEERVGEPLPRNAQRRVPGGGEYRVAAARGVGARNAHAGLVAGFGDDGGFGEGFTEDRHLLAGPAVVADCGKGGGRLW